MNQCVVHIGEQFNESGYNQNINNFHLWLFQFTQEQLDRISVKHVEVNLLPIRVSESVMHFKGNQIKRLYLHKESLGEERIQYLTEKFSGVADEILVW